PGHRGGACCRRFDRHVPAIQRGRRRHRTKRPTFRRNRVGRRSASSGGAMRKVELSSLTGIRFYAALLVYLAHIRAIPGMKAFIGAAWLIDAGHIGVSFFFVLSGFILTYNYADLFRDGVSARDYSRFVWGRLTKIYPVHFLATVVVLPISILSPGLPIDWRAVPVHLGLLQCLWPSTTPAFYEQLNVPSWSISCEWFFYALAPVTIFVAFGRRRRWVAAAAMAAYLCGLGIVR